MRREGRIWKEGWYGVVREEGRKLRLCGVWGLESILRRRVY